MSNNSPFVPIANRLAASKFCDPRTTAKGEPRASVKLRQLDTLWFNTGTLCNLSCENCYIESSPSNDALVYLELAEVAQYLDEIEALGLPTREIGFTGGEPFMNPQMLPILHQCLDRGYDVLLLTNAMRPMRRFENALLALPHRDRFTVRVSLDHYTQVVHEAERGRRSWAKTLDGLAWLSANDFKLAIAGRRLAHETEADARAGFAALFAEHGFALDAADTAQLVLFPEMDQQADIAEITTACWEILDVDPNTVMCSSSRMVVKRKGEPTPRVVACTLLPYAAEFDLGQTLSQASDQVYLNHPHCARFCVLGGASCSATE